jgi:hypothetical protein
MPVDNNELKCSNLRLASGTVPIRGFLCGDKEFGVCHVLDLGVVYNQFPDYKDGDPCFPVFGRRPDGLGGFECVRVSSEPNGTILDFKRACARLVVWTNAKIVAGELEYAERKIYYSRQRNKLPNKNGQDPIHCPAENGLQELCGRIGTKVGSGAAFLRFGGPYLNCPIKPSINGPCELDCNSSFRPQQYKFPLSNCEIKNDGTRYFAGYAENQSWWYVDEDYISTIEDEILANNPFDQILWSPTMTVYAHFQVEWKPIRCSNWEGVGGCNGSERKNKRGGSYTQGHKDQNKRERSVKITAAIGYSLGGCGYSPEKACEKTYDPSNSEKPFGNWIV